MTRRALAWPLAAVALGLVVAVALGLGSGGSGHRGGLASPAGARASAGTHARFAYLDAQGSNRCGLQAGEIRDYQRAGRLQGSCCSPMDEDAYREQVRRLRAFRGIPQIPRDPYDISVGLVKRLFRYDRAISLTGGELRTYRRAMAMTDTKGPCCCPCWRWTAFRGLSKYLIQERRWPAMRLAGLIEALDGCGGPSHEHASATTSGAQ